MTAPRNPYRLPQHGLAAMFANTVADEFAECPPQTSPQVTIVVDVPGGGADTRIREITRHLEKVSGSRSRPVVISDEVLRSHHPNQVLADRMDPAALEAQAVASDVDACTRLADDWVLRYGVDAIIKIPSGRVEEFKTRIHRYRAAGYWVGVSLPAPPLPVMQAAAAEEYSLTRTRLGYAQQPDGHAVLRAADQVRRIAEFLDQERPAHAVEIPLPQPESRYYRALANNGAGSRDELRAPAPWADQRTTSVGQAVVANLARSLTSPERKSLRGLLTKLHSRHPELGRWITRLRQSLNLDGHRPGRTPPPRRPTVRDWQPYRNGPGAERGG